MNNNKVLRLNRRSYPKNGKFEPSKKGFSLVELSIVLVILGLLVGGIMTGQNLIHAATLRAQIVQDQEIQTAIALFRENYFDIPGDLSNATQFWPSGGTANGNGDGILDETAPYEHLRLWQHLNLSGLFLNNASGVISGTSTCIPGDNLPLSKISSSAGITIGAGGGAMGPGTADYFVLISNNAFNQCFGAVIPAGDAYVIDKKMDDGLPRTGNVWGDGGFTGGSGVDCFDLANGNNAYLLNTTDIQCRLFMFH